MASKPREVEGVPVAGGVQEDQHQFAALEAAFAEPATCTELRIAAAQPLPPFRVEARTATSPLEAVDSV